MKRVVGYVRCSTEDQASNDFNTLEHQKEAITEYIQRSNHKGWKLLRFYEDTLSGKNMNRPGLQSMIADCRSGQIDAIVFYKFDRISRSLRDFALMDNEWTEAKIDSASVMEDWDTSTPSGKAMRNITLTFAEFEREQTAERTRNKMHAAAAKGIFCGGQIPFGYKSVDKQLKVIPEEAVHVKRAFELYAETSSLAAVRDYLNGHSVAPRLGTSRSGRRQPAVWQNQRVDRMLRNPIYKGTLRYKDILAPNAHEAIVSEELFEVAASIPRRHNRETVGDYEFPFLLSGKVICGHCGCRMSPKPTRHRNRRKSQTPYYECARVIKFGNRDCRVRRVNGELLEDTFFNQLDRLVENEALLDRAVARAVVSGQGSPVEVRDSISRTEEALNAIDSKISRLLEALESSAEAGNVAVIVDRLSKLEKENKVLERELVDLKSKLRSLNGHKLTTEEARQLLASARDLLAGGEDPDDKRRIVNALVKEVKVKEDGEIITALYCPLGVPNYNAFGRPLVEIPNLWEFLGGPRPSSHSIILINP